MEWLGTILLAVSFLLDVFGPATVKGTLCRAEMAPKAQPLRVAQEEIIEP